MIGILCATPEELEALREAVPFASVEGRAGFRFHIGSGLVFAETGMGKVNAATAATLLIALYNVSHVIFAGVAGALNPDLATGDLILANRVAAHDYGLLENGVLTPYPSGLCPLGPVPLGAIPLLPETVLTPLHQLMERMAGRIPARIRLGTVITGDSFVKCPASSRRFREQLAADAVDMESAAVVQVAGRFCRPAFIIRSISDAADEGSDRSYLANAAAMAKVATACVLELCELLDVEEAGATGRALEGASSPRCARPWQQ